MNNAAYHLQRMGREGHEKWVAVPQNGRRSRFDGRRKWGREGVELLQKSVPYGVVNEN